MFQVTHNSSGEEAPVLLFLGTNQNHQALISTLHGQACSILFWNTEHAFPKSGVFMQQFWRALEGCSVNRARLYFTADDTASLFAWGFLKCFARMFAAAVICGGAEDALCFAELKWLPIQVFDGGAANVSANLVVQALRAAGSECAVHRTENWLSKHTVQWLWEQDQMQQDRVQWLKPGLWSIEAGSIDSFYLVEGEEKAVVIDTGMNQSPLLPLVQKLTSLPVALVLTHAHFDHMLRAEEFDMIYCSSLEQELPEDFLNHTMPTAAQCVAGSQPLVPGQVLDLGGVCIEVVAASGHTPGSVLLIDHTHRCIFAGDAFGSGIGVLMAIPGTRAVTELRESAQAFLQRRAALQDYIWYSGHQIQAFGDYAIPGYYNPPSFDLLADLVTLCDRWLAGEELSCELQTNQWVDEPVQYITYGKASMWVTESQRQD